MIMIGTEYAVIIIVYIIKTNGAFYGLIIAFEWIYKHIAFSTSGWYL